MLFFCLVFTNSWYSFLTSSSVSYFIAFVVTGSHLVLVNPPLVLPSVIDECVYLPSYLLFSTNTLGSILKDSSVGLTSNETKNPAEATGFAFVPNCALLYLINSESSLSLSVCIILLPVPVWLIKSSFLIFSFLTIIRREKFIKWYKNTKLPKLAISSLFYLKWYKLVFLPALFGSNNTIIFLGSNFSSVILKC